MNTVVQLRPSTSVKPTVSPRRGKKNLDYRSQEYLDEAQIERLVVTAGKELRGTLHSSLANPLH
jgi:hypothetical protein